MRLQQPARNNFIAGGAPPAPKRSEPIQESLSLFLCHNWLPEVQQRRRTPCGQRLYDPLRTINGLEGAGIVVAKEADNTMVAPFEVRGCQRKRQRLIGTQLGLLDRSTKSATRCTGQQRPRVVVIQFASEVHVRRRLALPERHHIRPATPKRRPGIDRIRLNDPLREFKRRLCLAEIAEEARVNKML